MAMALANALNMTVENLFEPLGGNNDGQKDSQHGGVSTRI